MDQNIENKNICETCHQPILPTYYFCPNCGTKINSAPLSTTVGKQFGIYLFSIILPSICFLFITRWPGLKYFRSSDPKAKIIGEIALTLLILSTIFTFWYAYSWTQHVVQSTIDSMNVDLGNLTL